MPARLAGVLFVLLAISAVQARQVNTDAVADALTAALRPALPFPTAGPDGTAPDGSVQPVWTVRWPTASDLRVQVIANPFNADNRKRALEAEEQIQKAAMQSQRQSQADYERAVGDFQRTGRVSEIREISLNDEGVAGERYDAESQLTVTAEFVDKRHDVTVFTSALPASLPVAHGPAVVIRVRANTYQEAAIGSEPGRVRFCPEQAWVFFGSFDAPIVTRQDVGSVAVSVSRAAGADATRGLMIWMSGNAELVDRVLQRADWLPLRSRLGG